MTISYNLDDYKFHLPQELIAQHPAPTRDGSRLMLVRGQQSPVHHQFSDLDGLLEKGDLLVLNQTKVMRARTHAFKDNGVRIEVFFLNIQVDPSQIPVLFRPGKRVKPGMKLHFPKADVWVEVTGKEGGQGILCLPDRETLMRVLELDGEMPLPPYIKRDEGPDSEDERRYQTVYAGETGAVAAPTAGLHFTDALLQKLQDKGIELCFVTHHVGIGTFKPVIVDDVREHVMEFETYTIDTENAERLNHARAQNRRIIAVGTTSTRCLESNVREDGRFEAGSASTDHYIYPGYRFKAISGLITNFHLPGSSLMLLVSALMGRETIMDAYAMAIEQGYRFYSYGDAMLLLPTPSE